MPVSSTVLPYDLTGHVALITGANHGIGAATARVLARCGAAVLVSYIYGPPIQRTFRSRIVRAVRRGLTRCWPQFTRRGAGQRPWRPT